MEPGAPYTALGIMAKLGLHSRDIFMEHYLHPAMEMGLARMTVPEKPRSRNQRYIRV